MLAKSSSFLTEMADVAGEAAIDNEQTIAEKSKIEETVHENGLTEDSPDVDKLKESEDERVNGDAVEESNKEDPATLEVSYDFTEVTLPWELTQAVSNARTAEAKFAVLTRLSDAVEISDRDLVDTVFNLVSFFFVAFTHVVGLTNEAN